MSGRRLTRLFALAALGMLACDPPPEDFRPLGGYAARTDTTGEAAIRAVLVTPSHGYYRTVREALSSYVGSAGDEVEVRGWYANSNTADVLPHYIVAFAWHDGKQDRSADWELNRFGVWPINDEARFLSVYPPDPRD